jgi:hypothetical protein
MYNFSWEADISSYDKVRVRQNMSDEMASNFQPDKINEFDIQLKQLEL